jgi:hypothetical protein
MPVLEYHHTERASCFSAAGTRPGVSAQLLETLAQMMHLRYDAVSALRITHGHGG